MNTDLFGGEVSKEASFTITYQGDSFAGGKIAIKPLYTELQSVERLIKESIKILIETGKLDATHRDVEIFVEIQKGSIKEIVKIVFGVETAAQIVVQVVAGLIGTTYDHFLNRADPSSAQQFQSEISTIRDNESYKKDLQNLLSPLSDNTDNIVINNGNINVTVNYGDKEELAQSLNQEEQEDDTKKNGEFEESLTGVIRKLDLDAQGQNYFGFNIENGQSKVPTRIQGEFNLLDYKEIIDKKLRIRAMVRYKNDTITHIEILEYTVLDEQSTLPM